MHKSCWVLGCLFLLVGSALVASEPPWPTPPPDDDDPLFFRRDDLDHTVEILDRFISWEDTASIFQDGGIIVSARGRARRNVRVDTYAVDFLFWLGADAEPGYGRFKVVRVTRTQILKPEDFPPDTPAVELRVEESGELVLASSMTSAGTSCFADCPAALRACRTAIADAAVRSFTLGLVPYYSLQRMRVPVGADYSAGGSVPVSIEFVNQTDRDDRYTLTVDFIPGDRGGIARLKEARRH